MTEYGALLRDSGGLWAIGYNTRIIDTIEKHVDESGSHELAHIVLDDYNLDSHNVNCCLAALRAEPAQDTKTISLLEWILTIPECGRMWRVPA